MKVVFATPAYKRVDLSEICFKQHAWCHQELAKQGIESTSVVVANDGNLQIAKKLGFEVVKRDNKYLGRKFNDGYQQAHKLGADYVVPLGSDSWIHPSYFSVLSKLKQGQFLTGRHYGLIDEDGKRLGYLVITVANGVGPHIIPVELMAERGYRPVQETLSRGCDGSLLQAVAPKPDKTRWLWSDRFPLQYVAFRTHGQQLNPYENLTKKYLQSESRRPWHELRKVYPQDLVEQAERLYRARRTRA